MSEISRVAELKHLRAAKERKLKTASLYPFLCDVRCPHCDELVSNAEGLGWHVNMIIPRQMQVCNECQEQFQMPSRVEAVEL